MTKYRLVRYGGRMRTRTLVCLPLVALLFSLVAAHAVLARSEENVASKTTTTSFAITPVAESATVSVSAEPTKNNPVFTPPEPNTILVDHLEERMLAWANVPDCTTEGKSEADVQRVQIACDSWEKIQRESVDQTRIRYHSIAVDVAQAAAIEHSPYSEDPLNARMANLVSSLAFNESRFEKFVDDGRCNDKKWQGTEEGKHLTKIGGNCDGTYAHSMWQLHAGFGLVLLTPNRDNGFRELISNRDAENWAGQVDIRWQAIEHDYDMPPGFRHEVDSKNITGEANRLLAARTAWHMLSNALKASKFTNICRYTGEPLPCPKSEVRLKFADDEWRKHPITVTKES